MNDEGLFLASNRATGTSDIQSPTQVEAGFIKRVAVMMKRCDATFTWGCDVPYSSAGTINQRPRGVTRVRPEWRFSVSFSTTQGCRRAGAGRRQGSGWWEGVARTVGRRQVFVGIRQEWAGRNPISKKHATNPFFPLKPQPLKMLQY